MTSRSPQQPPPAYIAPPSSTVHASSPVYRKVAASAAEESARRLENRFTIAPCSGQAWVVRAGQVCRISTPEGPQVGDLNIWNAHNPREPGGQLDTVLDTQGNIIQGKGFGTTQWGGRVHDLLGTRCDPYVNLLMGGETFDFHCHSNLTRAVVPFGLTELDVHDVLNVFQVTGLDEQGKYFMEASPARPEEYFEFFAEIDVLCALSACPGGDLSQWGWEGKEGGDMAATCRPLGVEVYSLADSEILKDWKQPESPNYTGMHGLKMPTRDDRRKGHVGV
ncbi:hypothetical protein EIK77_010153 [Talaromyces pinophilus]|nr:hypothetical protein EIK77_010153 [Talaromyces pinophilus]PCG90149.1 protein of unknown function DUF1989 [Penicillium occitanis (nom. inval.)]PCG95836.1 hypothetical protein PENOC_075810 [Penicillium occitanis (nom. inval.)]